MDVFIYQAALLCEDCGTATREALTEEGKAPADPSDEASYDSDVFPKGPMPEGEADSPSHCDQCHTFLENALTDEGRAYLCEKLIEALHEGRVTDPLREWKEFYDVTLDDLFEYVLAQAQADDEARRAS